MLNYVQTEQEPKTETNLLNICLFESENGDGRSEQKCDQEGSTHDLKKFQPGQRQKRTNFTLLQRHELEKAFSQCQYLTPHSCRRLQELGIHKQNIKVWFKNRRVKWRKEMRNWGLPEKGKTVCMPCNSSQENDSPTKRSPLLPEVDRNINEGISMQGLALVPSESSALSYYSDVCDGQWNSTGQNSFRPTNMFYRESKGFPFETEAPPHIQSSINSTDMTVNFSFMGNSSQGEITLDAGDTRASWIRGVGRLSEGIVTREPYVMRELMRKPQYQPSYQLSPPCTEKIPGHDQRSVVPQIYETDQTVPSQKRDPEDGYNRLPQRIEPLNGATTQDSENGSLLDDLMNIIAKEQLEHQRNLQQNSS